VRTNAAAIAAEGAVKPTSTYTVVRIEDKLDVIASVRSVAANVDGGLAFVATVFEQRTCLRARTRCRSDGDCRHRRNERHSVASVSTSVLQTLRKSVTWLESNGYPPATFVLHPTDWETTELAVASVNAIEHMSLPFDP
jgi:hypothetical protein